jgi:penicillin-binding protein 1C
MIRITRRRRVKLLAGGAALALLAAFWFSLPRDLFPEPPSPVLFSDEGTLLGARPAPDGQWRFPRGERVPERFFQVLLQYEDRRFFSHPGVDPLAVARALRLNLRSGRVKSGASTITMQLVRLSRKNRPRTVWEKAKEAVIALRLELKYSKTEILSLFAAHAPFGGNVVGIDAAAWMYFGRSPERLSWAEAAYLAVLPKDPSLIATAEGRKRLLVKRDALLGRLEAKGMMSELECRLGQAEPIPDGIRPVPRDAPHLLETLAAAASRSGRRGTPFRTFIRSELQRSTARVLEAQGEKLFSRGIRNLAAVVIDNRTSAVVAYVGNVGLDRRAECGQNVDILQRPRSTGSILKPFLFAAMIREGVLAPQTLVADTPVRFEAFKPENFDRRYRGAVPARTALAWSLNVPAVRELREFGVPRFENLLRQWGMTTLDRPPDDYGLTLILGGAEGKLFEIASLYSKMAQLAAGAEGGGREIRLLRDEPASRSKMRDLGEGAAFLTLDALTEVNRPDEEGFWRNFSSSKWLAWKTGTSFGLRDAWACGVTPNYTIGVWAGNADGEGKPGLTGLLAAAPVLFELLGTVDGGGAIGRPRFGLKPVQVCRDSGFLATSLCPAVTAWVPEESHFDRMCVFHRPVSLDASGRFRVDSRCESVDRMRHKSWFVLPPVQEYYFRADHPEYRPLPPWLPGCGRGGEVDGEGGTQVMNLIYPEPETSVFIPVDLDGRQGEVVFEAVHRQPDETIYWHIDDRFVASTRRFHRVSVNPEPGDHVLVLTDGDGRRLVRPFRVINPAGRGH